MRERALSSDGFIINQGLLSDQPFGARDCRYGGCAVIAAFNLLRAQGRTAEFGELKNEFEKRLTFRGTFGVMPTAMDRFLRTRGFAPERAMTRAGALRLAAAADSGVLLYHTGKSLHYVAFYSVGGGAFRFLNAVYGDDRQVCTMEDFLKSCVKGPLVYLWAVPRRAA